MSKEQVFDKIEFLRKEIEDFLKQEIEEEFFAAGVAYLGNWLLTSLILTRCKSEEDIGKEIDFVIEGLKISLKQSVKIKKLTLKI